MQNCFEMISPFYWKPSSIGCMFTAHNLVKLMNIRPSLPDELDFSVRNKTSK